MSSATRTTNAAQATALPTNADRRMIIGRLAARTMALVSSMNTAVTGISAPMGFVAGIDDPGSPMPTASVLGNSESINGVKYFIELRPDSLFLGCMMFECLTYESNVIYPCICVDKNSGVCTRPAPRPAQ